MTKEAVSWLAVLTKKGKQCGLSEMAEKSVRTQSQGDGSAGLVLLVVVVAGQGAMKIALWQIGTAEN